MKPPAPIPPVSLLAQGVQGELIPLEDLPDGIYEPDEAGENASKPRYTAGRFFRKRPDDYQRCVEFLAAGMGLLKIARLLKVHHETVAAVRDCEPEKVDISRQRIRKHLRLAVEIGAERMPDVMATLPGGQLTVPLAILIERLRDLDGEPTQRIEVTHRGHLTHEAVQAALDQFPEAIEAEALPMGLGALPGSQKALGDGAAASDEGGQAPGSSPDAAGQG